MDISAPIDVLVIGAGPAAVAAALTCLEAGLKVTVAATPRKQPRHIESIHPGTAQLLEQLQLQNAIQSAVIGRYKGVEVNGEYQPLSSNASDDWYGLHLNRAEFDTQLKDALAVRKVAILEDYRVRQFELEKGGRCRVQLDGRPDLYCRYLIDASGHQRVLGRVLRLGEQQLSPPLWTFFQTLSDKTHRHQERAYFSTTPNGWDWTVTGQDEQQYQTSVSIHQRPARDAVVRQVTAMRWRLFDQLAGPGFLLTGDAAGLLDPAAGQGILFALRSGIAAGRSVCRMLEFPQTAYQQAIRYEEWYRTMFLEKARALAQRYKDLGIAWL